MRRSTALRSDEQGRVPPLWGDIPTAVPAPLERFRKDTRSEGVFQRSIKGVEDGGRPPCLGGLSYCRYLTPKARIERVVRDKTYILPPLPYYTVR